MARAGRTVVPVMVPTGQPESDHGVPAATSDPAMLAVLSSAAHYWWACSASHDRFERFVAPELNGELRVLGKRLDSYRRDLMTTRQAELTATYHLLDSPVCVDNDIVGLRRIHIGIDEAVVSAYGWHDLLGRGLDHGFHETQQGVRYTVGLTARWRILSRLQHLGRARSEYSTAPRPARPPAPARPRHDAGRHDAGRHDGGRHDGGRHDGGRIA